MQRLSLVGISLLFLVALIGCNKSNGIERLDPEVGSVAGNDEVVIYGNGFKAGMTVRFGKREAQRIRVESDTKIHVRTPSGPEGKVDVVLTDDSGKSFIASKAFTYKRAGQ